MRALCPRPARRGFTLVEVLIVVVILGILAATVLPQFTSSTIDAKEAALKQNLQQIRGQIDLFRFQHNGTLPAKGSSTESEFLNAMLFTSKLDGTLGDNANVTTGAPGDGPYGPYLIGQFPPNPFNGKNSISMVAANPVDGTTGWWYNSTTGEFRANLTITDLAKDGTKLSSF